MKNKVEIWSVIVLEILFGLCALSVLLFRVMGWAYDFGPFSYRVFNIVLSLLFMVYLVYALLKSQEFALILAGVFSLFHFIEGIIIIFWYKTIIHALVLVVVGIYYLRHKTLRLGV